MEENTMTATIKNVTVDNNNDDLVTFAQEIDFTELFDHIKAFAKVNCAFYRPEITTARGSVYISILSDNFASQTGPFAAILERCCFRSFNNGVYRDKETGEPGYWVSVNIRYEHKDGGENGMDVTRAWYSASKGWIFQDTGNR
jgi:hypothetical protein